MEDSPGAGEGSGRGHVRRAAAAGRHRRPPAAMEPAVSSTPGTAVAAATWGASQGAATAAPGADQCQSCIF
ncbi:hypothetical protein ACP4OV_007638 [Aristida adscensionis]